jgi:hypothetical protein
MGFTLSLSRERRAGGVSISLSLSSLERERDRESARVLPCGSTNPGDAKPVETRFQAVPMLSLSLSLSLSLYIYIYIYICIYIYSIETAPFRWEATAGRERKGGKSSERACERRERGKWGQIE